MPTTEHSGVSFVSKQSAAEGRNVYVWSTKDRSLIRTKLVKPGDHFAFCDATGDIIDDEFFTFTFLWLGNYSENLDDMEGHNPAITSLTEMTAEIKSAVLNRDKMRCSVAGVPLHKDDARVACIVPPALRFLSFELLTDAFNISQDGYKIMHFNLPPNLDVSLIQPSPDSFNSGSQVNEAYLRSHFSRCLLQAMGNGDVKDDIKLPDISEFLLDHEIRSVRAIKPSNNIWRDTDIGRLVFTWLKGREPDSDNGEARKPEESDDDGSDSDGSDSDSNEDDDSDSDSDLSSDYYRYEQPVCDGY
ncbi:hypothetical protein DXG03_003945 [Asterophora parasitica]|uniref:Uncharacterized protein n=1 Tax=Asterophora parasitica TaxID=117018 RepID=A0A9P7G725_9AGAR|nr:hypothetical protein DXG03_003945 [Asterophora parasitica]